MAEYIEREEAEKRLFQRAEIANSAYIDQTPYQIMMLARNVVHLIPAADVAPIRRGRYIGEYDGFADGSPVYDMWYCSECGCYFEEWDEKPTYNYCPNCGARMDTPTIIEAEEGEI